MRDLYNIYCKGRSCPKKVDGRHARAVPMKLVNRMEDVQGTLNSLATLHTKGTHSKICSSRCRRYKSETQLSIVMSDTKFFTDYRGLLDGTLYEPVSSNKASVLRT